MYRLSKFLRRNPIPVAAASAALAIAVTTTTLAFTRIAAERDLAESERRKAEAISGFMQQIFEVSDPEESRGANVSARDLLEEGARRVRADLTSQPDTQVTMMRVLGEVYYGLGDWDSARGQLEEALRRAGTLNAANSAEIATIKLLLGFVEQDQGRLDEAFVLMDEARRIRESLYGRYHFDVVEAISALAFLEESRGDYEASEALHAEALALSRDVAEGDHEFVAESMAKLGGLYRIIGRNDEAEPLLNDALAMQQRLYQGEHPQMSDTKRQLAGLYRETRRYEESEKLYLEVIDERIRMLGELHAEVAHTWNSYAQLLDSMGERERALQAYRHSLDLLERIHDGPHPSFGALYNNLAVTLKQQGQFDEALRYYQLSIDMQDAAELPPRHPNRSFPLGGMANAYLALDRFEESAALARNVLELRREHFDESHRLVSEVKNILGAALTGTGAFSEAEQILMDAYASFLAEYGESHPGVSLAAFNLAELFSARGDTGGRTTLARDRSAGTGGGRDRQGITCSLSRSFLLTGDLLKAQVHPGNEGLVTVRARTVGLPADDCLFRRQVVDTPEEIHAIVQSIVRR